MGATLQDTAHGIIGLVVEYSLAMAVTWVRFPDDASASMGSCGPAIHHVAQRSIAWPIDPKLSIAWPSYPPCGQAIIHAVKLSSMRPCYPPRWRCDPSCGHVGPCYPSCGHAIHNASCGHAIHHVSNLPAAKLSIMCPMYPSCVRSIHHAGGA